MKDFGLGTAGFIPTWNPQLSDSDKQYYKSVLGTEKEISYGEIDPRSTQSITIDITGHVSDDRLNPQFDFSVSANVNFYSKPKELTMLQNIWNIFACVFGLEKVQAKGEFVGSQKVSIGHQHLTEDEIEGLKSQAVEEKWGCIELKKGEEGLLERTSGSLPWMGAVKKPYTWTIHKK